MLRLHTQHTRMREEYPLQVLEEGRKVLVGRYSFQDYEGNQFQELWGSRGVAQKVSIPDLFAVGDFERIRGLLDYDSELGVDYNVISTGHFLLEKKEDGYYITDLSQNGTSVRFPDPPGGERRTPTDTHIQTAPEGKRVRRHVSEKLADRCSISISHVITFFVKID